MRLVHRYKGDLHPADKGQKVLGAKPLRRDVQQLVRPLLSPAVDLVVLGKAQRGIDAAAGIWDCSSAATWSFISEISGEITSVNPGSIMAGSW